jgi:hypothetical protein
VRGLLDYVAAIDPPVGRQLAVTAHGM